MKKNVEENDGILCLIPTKERSRLTKILGYGSMLTPRKFAFMGTKGLRPELFFELEKKGHKFLIVDSDKKNLETFACALPSLLLICDDPSLNSAWCPASFAVDYAVGISKEDQKNLAAGFLAKNFGTNRCLLRLENFKDPVQSLGIERVFRPALSFLNALLRAIKPRFVSHWYAIEPHGSFLEVVLNDESKSLGWTVDDFEIKTGWRFLVLARDEELFWNRSVQFQEKDHVVFWSVSCQCKEMITQLYNVLGCDKDSLPLRFLNFFFPWLCFGCGQEVVTPGFCSLCWPSLTFVFSPFCPLCGSPANHEMEGHACKRCCQHVPHFASHRSLWIYGALSRKVLFSLKYGRKAYLAYHLAQWMIPQVMERSFSWVVPVPLHPRRLKKRGFNQAALLGQCLAKLLGVSFEPRGLERSSDSGSQGGLSYRGRQENVMGAFVSRRQWTGQSILLVDDVLTTGATLNACAAALLEGGASQVHGQTVLQVV